MLFFRLLLRERFWTFVLQREFTGSSTYIPDLAPESFMTELGLRS